ncbi:MAG: Fic family protein, partial [Gammaproteobacteria bacterium]|nr:Fic family protein [Gammaproteobacteria bacterium]
MDIFEYKSGSYKDGYKYKYFLPSKVNHLWVFSDPKLMQLLSDADRALGELNAFSQLIPDVDYFIRMHLGKEATQSSRIEGTQTNIEEVFLNVHDVDPEKRDDWEEVQNYISAINSAIEKLKNLPLSNRLLKETHGVLMRGVRGDKKNPGEFRLSQNWIGVSLQNAVFVPPHHEYVAELMGDLELFLNNENSAPHLIKIAIAHYQFETIHPFLDGNGRLGRLMIALYLASFELLYKPALYLSDYFERNKSEYVNSLMAVRQSNNMKDWLIFFLFGVLETSKNSIQVFKDVILLKSKLESEVLPHFSSRRQVAAQTLMKHLYKNPVVTIKDVSELLQSTPNTASTLLDDYVKHGVLVELKNRRSRLYRFNAYMAIFDKTLASSFASTPHQEDVTKDQQEDITKNYQEDVAKDYQEDVAKDYQEDVAKDYQEDVAKDYQEDVAK